MGDEEPETRVEADQIAELVALRARVAALEAGAAKSRSYLEGVLDCAPDAIVVLDIGHHVLAWNRGAERLFGYTASEAIGRDPDELIFASDALMLQQSKEFVRCLLASPSQMIPPTETIRYHRDGRALHVMVAASPVLVDGELRGVVAVYTHITARKRAERDNERHSRTLETLLRINAALRSTLPLQQVLDTIVQSVGEMMDYPGVLIAVPDEAGTRLRLGAAWGSELLSAALEEVAFDPGRLSLPLTVERNPMVHTFLRGELETWDRSLEMILKGIEPTISAKVARTLAQKMQSRLAIYVPLVIGLRTAGVLLVFSKRDRLEADERDVLQSLAGQAGLAIETARCFEETEYLKAFSESIVQSMAEGIAVGDAAGCVVFLNAAALAMLGYDRHELIGRHWTVLVPPDQQPIVEAAITRRLTGKSDRYRIELARRDGTCLPVEVSGNPRLDATGHFAGSLAVFSDASERERAEAATARRAREMAALYETSLEINSQRDVAALLPAIVRRAAELLGLRLGALYLLRRGEDTLELAVMHNHPAGLVGTRLALGTGLAGRAAQEGRPMMVADYAQWEGRARVYEGVPFRRVLAVPLQVQGRVIGVITVADSEQTGLFDQDEVRLVALFADQAAIAIDNARLFEEAQQRLGALTVLFDASAAASSSLDADRVVRSTAKIVTVALATEGCTVSLWDPALEALVVILDYSELEDWDGDPVGTVYRLADYPATARVLQTRQVLQIQVDDPEADPAEVALMIRQNFRSLLMVPLVVRDKVIGLLEMVEETRARRFAPTEISLCQTLANQMAASLENARLFQAEHTSRERAEALRHAAQAVSASLDLDEILRRILEQLREVLIYHTASVLIFREAQTLELVVGLGYENGEQTSREAGMKLQDSPILQRLAADLQPIVCADVRQLENWIWVPGAEHVRSWLGIPLVAQGRMIGALMVDHSEPGFYKEADLQIVQALAQHAAQAIEHARLFKAEREQRVLAEALRSATAAVSSTLDLDQVLDRILEQVSAVLPGDANSVILIEGETARLVRWRGYNRFATDDAMAALRLSVRGTGSLRRMVDTGRPSVIPDTEAEPEWVWMAETHWIRSHAGAPIRVRDEVVGFLVVDSATPGFFNPTHADALQAFADSASVAVANARLFEETVRRNRELALLNRIIGASAASQEIEPILALVCRELVLALDLSGGGALLLNDERTHATVVGEYPPAGPEQKLPPGVAPALGLAMPINSQSALSDLVNQSAPMVIADPQTSEQLAPFNYLCRDRAVVTLLLLPLIVEGQTLGVIALAAVQPREFSGEEIDLAWRVTGQVAGALTRVRLAKTQQQLSIAVEQAAESVVITDPVGNILYVNPAFEHITGYSRAEAIGHNPRLLRSGKQDTAFYQQLWQTITSDQVWEGQLVNKKKDGSLYTEKATISPVHNQAGEIISYVAVKRDVTREVQLEEQFRQAQKMEAMGRLAGGIAHDFNNLLTVIQVSAWLMQRQIRPEDPLWESVHRIQDTVERASNLVKQLLSFSRRQIIEPRTVNLNQVVADMSRMLQRIIGEDVRLITALAPDLWPVHVDPTQVEQIVMNLGINARDAMPGGGTVTIETANVVLDPAYASLHIGAHPGEHVLLAITDTGVGITDEVKARLFEPFFTTKTPGQGSGLGLATVFGIVNQNNGHIWVTSEPGQGATFQVYLPRSVTRQPEAPAPRVPLVAGGRGNETILVVEDEIPVRELIERLLAAHGYKVLTAADGPAAIEASDRHPGPIDLLLTDVIMPLMNGRELAGRLQQRRPAMHVLYMSGYTDDALAPEGTLDPGTVLVAKPFSMDVLIYKIRTVLGERRDG